MSLHRLLPLIACALLLGLAACGGGSSGGMERQDPAVAQREDVAKAIRAAVSAVDALDEESTTAAIDAAVAAVAAAKREVAEADTLSAAEKGVFEDSVETIESRLTSARSRIEVAREERRREMDAERMKLTAAVFSTARISPVVADFAHGTAPVMSGTVPGTPATDITGLETGASGAATTAGGWTGRTYRAADNVSGVIDTVVLHSDIAAPGSRPFSGEGGKYDGTNGLAQDGSLPIAAGTDPMLLASLEFPTAAGIVEHPAGEGGTVQVAGSYDGADGAYICTPAGDSPCTSSVRHDGGIDLAGGGGWRFVPVPDAMVATPDLEYRYFGWWLRDTGDAQAVGVFHAGVGGAEDEFASFTALQGPARYRGPAVGKFALNPQLGAASAGDFTATVILRAAFGDGTDPGTIEGTVDEFHVGGEKMPWSVTLGTAGIGADGSIAADGASAAGTVWSIEGTAGGVPGKPPTWQGQLHDVNPQRVPSVATGGFEAAYGEIGRMIGAFGASLQEQ